MKAQIYMAHLGRRIAMAKIAAGAAEQAHKVADDLEQESQAIEKLGSDVSKERRKQFAVKVAEFEYDRNVVQSIISDLQYREAAEKMAHYNGMLGALSDMQEAIKEAGSLDELAQSVKSAMGQMAEAPPVAAGGVSDDEQFTAAVEGAIQALVELEGADPDDPATIQRAEAIVAQGLQEMATEAPPPAGGEGGGEAPPPESGGGEEE